jgi:hypothetical protein
VEWDGKPGRMPPRMGAWQPERLRYGAATKNQWLAGRFPERRRRREKEREIHFRLGEKVFLKRCGGRGLRVFAERIPAASDLVGIYEDVGAVLITLSTSSVPSFRFTTSVSDGAAIGAIRTPPAIIRSNGRSSRRSPPRRGTTVKLSRACGKSVPPQMQRILASMKTCCGRAGPGGTPVRAASLQFESSMRGQAFLAELPLSS